MVQILVEYNKTFCLDFEQSSVYCDELLIRLEECLPFDHGDFYLVYNGRPIYKGAVPSSPSVVRVCPRLRGGKGGFGAMLRSMGKGAGSKKTTDFGACRDLSGRRLRHVNNEVRLQKWLERKDDDNESNLEEETKSGIEGWYLGVPSWAEGVGGKKNKGYMKQRKKTSICKNWQQAREERQPPAGAPKWWGCPRGRDCDFAHGEDELRGKGLVEYRKKVNEDISDRQKQSLDTYIAFDTASAEDMKDAVRQGLSRTTDTKKRKLEEDNAISKTLIDKSLGMGDDYWLVSAVGKVKVGPDGEVEGSSDFSTAIVAGCALGTGRWYYEVELLTGGLMQIGWINDSFKGDEEEGDGVGDDANSWAYDGVRQQKWNGLPVPYGEAWEAGDIIGCLIDVDAQVLRFTRNGSNMGVAFKGLSEQAGLVDPKPKTTTYCPAFSLEQGEALKVNIGERDLSHIPIEDDYKPVLFGIIQNKKLKMPGSPPCSENDKSTRLIEGTSLDAGVQISESGPPVKSGNAALQSDAFDLFEWSKYPDMRSLEGLGLQKLKDILMSAGLKCGGTLQERAARLQQVRGLQRHELPAKLQDRTRASRRSR